MTWKPLSSRTKLGLWCLQLMLVLVVFCYVWLSKPFAIIADINQIFTVQQTQDVRLVSDQIEQQQLRQHLMLVGSINRNRAIVSAQYAAKQLQTIDGINVKLQFGPLPQLSSIVQDYIPYQHAFISDEYKKRLNSDNLDELFNYQFNLINEVGTPWVAASLESDPSLSLADFFNKQRLPSTHLKNDDGYLIAKKANSTGQVIHYVLINFVSSGTGLDLNVANEIADKVAKLKKHGDTNIEYLVTGAAFFTANASNSAQREMTLFGGISIIATLLLILVVYRSALSVACTLFVISISMLYGYIALRLLFTEVNILTLVFAVTLIGIAADYSFHALSELRFGKVNFKNPLANIRSSLLLGFITTAAGYLILALTPLALFKQIAVFTMAGLLGALLTVLLVFPSISARIVRQQRSVSLLIKKLNNWQQIGINKRITASWQLILVVSMLAGLSLVKNIDDPRTFYESSDSLITQQQKITSILNSQWDSAYILVSGTTPEQVLQRTEDIIPTLKQLEDTDQLSAFSTVSQWLPSIEAQQKNQQLMVKAQSQGKFSQLDAVLGETDIQAATKEYKQLDFTTWQASNLAPLFTNQWLQVNNRYYSIIKLKDASDKSALKTELNHYKDVVLVDKVTQVSVQIGQFRQHLMVIYILALLAAMLVFWLRYGVKSALLAISRPVIAIVVALSVSAIFFGSLSIFNYVAGILILALGLDYCVFYAEHGHCEKITLTTLVSALSSLFVFAILIVSSTPAVSQFGFTVFVGVVVVFIIAPRLALVSKRNH